jgi:hypothetical protein
MEAKIEKVLINAIDEVARRKNGPASIIGQLKMEVENLELDLDESILEETTHNILLERPLKDDAIQAIGKLLRKFDAEGANVWTKGTENNTEERRRLLYKKLSLPETIISRLDKDHPYAKVDRPLLITEDYEKWYTPERKKSDSFYWEHLYDYLEAEWKDPDNLAVLDRASDSIVGLLADPLRQDAYPCRGLVVGYVQSGKTANFTSVIAKAVDAGYRLVIVLAGQWDLLRIQTQRRLDKELVGKEIIDKENEHEYQNDSEWESFISHFGMPKLAGNSNIYRLTSGKDDYLDLKKGIQSLEFEGHAYPNRSFNHKENLITADTKLVVMKKNSIVLQRLIHDLGRLANTNLDEVPALIIDDESDQASVNTKAPSRNEIRERTAINKRIIDLLKLLPRAQYVGYTATPFANIFVDVDDIEDIFPRHFIYALERPASHYMGVRDFFDFDEAGNPLDKADIESGCFCNQEAYIKPFTEGKDDEEALRDALRIFVLTGAIKLYRAEHGQLNARHHTMLIHRSPRIADHEKDKELVQSLWDKEKFGSQKSHIELGKLFINDISKVSGHEKFQDLIQPDNYDELRPYVEKCLIKITEQEPYIRVVNGEKRFAEQAPRFDRDPVWSVLVGGTKLSRGYTVEGLTVSYFMRRTMQVDTLMQMGRWFGFRKGYRDLVRVYLQEGSTERKRDMNLITAFRSACMDEEALRKDLKKYKDNGEITPKQVTPVVLSHWLRPTATNKMHNAILVNTNFGGEWMYTTLNEPSYRKANVDLLRKLLDSKDVFSGDFKLGRLPDGKKETTEFIGYHTEIMPGEMRDYFDNYAWPDDFKRFIQVQRFLEGKEEWDPEIDSWLFIAPQLQKAPKFKLNEEDELTCFGRKFTDNRRFDAVTEPKHRELAEYIAMKNREEWVEPNNTIFSPSPLVTKLRKKKQGIFLFYPVIEKSAEKKWVHDELVADEHITVSMTLFFPENKIPKAVQFGVKDSANPDALIIDSDE